jgi:hypothetical protein
LTAAEFFPPQAQIRGGTVFLLGSLDPGVARAPVDKPETARLGTLYHPFILPPADAAIADTQIRPIAAQFAVSDECVEQWIAHGIWGACKVDESKIDLDLQPFA